jgi:sugar lactone lactonase YvrE
MGVADGVGSDARFHSPHGIAVDVSGNIYVGDMGNFVVRKITLDKGVTTLAGSAGNFGAAEGVGVSAKFGTTGQLAVDSGGNVYMADPANARIWIISPTGSVTTLARSNQLQSAGVAVDEMDNVYLGDIPTASLYKISALGVLATLIDGSSWERYFPVVFMGSFDIGELAVDSSEKLYVVDRNDKSILIVTPTGHVTKLVEYPVGSFPDVQMVQLRRKSDISGIAVDKGGNVFVSDANLNTIKKITPKGDVYIVGGLTGVSGGTNGIGDKALFSGPTGVAVDAAGNIYIADTGNNTIRMGVAVLTNPAKK